MDQELFHAPSLMLCPLASRTAGVLICAKRFLALALDK